MNKAVEYAKLGAKIKEIRLKRGLTQDNLAELIGCNVSHISNIENNYTKLSLNALFAIADVLNVSMDYLLSEQYSDSASALDRAIMEAIKDCDTNKKERILQMIEIM